MNPPPGSFPGWHLSYIAVSRKQVTEWSSYNAKVHIEQGGDTLVLESGASISVNGTTYTTAELATLLAVVAAIPATDQGDSETIWNDSGVLKVSGQAANTHPPDRAASSVHKSSP